MPFAELHLLIKVINSFNFIHKFLVLIFLKSLTMKRIFYQRLLSRAITNNALFSVINKDKHHSNPALRFIKAPILAKEILIVVLLAIIYIPCNAQIQATGCYSSTNVLEACGASWNDNYNGQSYHCTCNCAIIPPAVCNPVSSSSGSSEGSIPGQTAPGDVSLDQGKPFFTTHQSSAFTDWAEDYKQELESYGITSLLGKNITPNQVPVTSDTSFNRFYKDQSTNFHPAVPNQNKESSDKPLPIMGNTPMTADERERQKFGPRYIDGMTYIRPDKGLDASTDPTYDLSDSKQYKIVSAGFDKLGNLPLGELPAYVGGLVLSFETEVDKFITDATINKVYSDEELENMNVVQHIVYNVAKGEVVGSLTSGLNSIIKKSGIGYLKTKFGDAAETDAKLIFKLYGDAKTTIAAWNAKWQ